MQGSIESKARILPYVVTDDIEIVMGRLPQAGIAIPDRRVLSSASYKIQNTLNDIFQNLDVLPASRISRFLTEKAEKSDIPVVPITSLIKPSNSGISLNLSRSVKICDSADGAKLFQSIGLQPRNRGDLECAEQFNRVANALRGSKVALIDDVVFSGGTVCTVIDELASRGVEVKEVISSVAIGIGAEALQKRDIRLVSDKIYEEVIDEVCMRDFIVAVPGGGRNCILDNGRFSSVPYISPFGEVGSWASIPGCATKAFSNAAISASLDLWRAIEERNDRQVFVRDLQKPIFSWNDDDRIVDRLEAALN